MHRLKHSTSQDSFLRSTQLQSNGIPSFYGGFNGQISQLYMPCSPSNEFQSAMNLHNFNSSSGLTPRSTLCAHYIFNEKEVEVNQGTPRTTLMVRNIPNKYRYLMNSHGIQWFSFYWSQTSFLYMFAYVKFQSMQPARFHYIIRRALLTRELSDYGLR